MSDQNHRCFMPLSSSSPSPTPSPRSSDTFVDAFVALQPLKASVLFQQASNWWARVDAVMTKTDWLRRSCMSASHTSGVRPSLRRFEIVRNLFFRTEKQCSIGWNSGV